MGDLSHVTDVRDLSRRRFIRLSASSAVGVALARCDAMRNSLGGSGPRLITTLGDLALPDTGVILPHEHIFLDPRAPSDQRQAPVHVDDVVEVMQPELAKARAAGVVVLVDAGSPAMGRRADIIVAVSQAARLPVVVPTGLYTDPSIPEWARAASEDQLRDWMIGELTDGIEGADVTAGWIKLGAGDRALTEQEAKALRAAARAGTATDATIGCHSGSGTVARSALDIVEQSGYRAERFVWIHADQDSDSGMHTELARRGAWVEFDSIGSPQPMHDPLIDDAAHIEMIQHMLDAGLGHRVLLSMDRGWYDPGRPDCRAGCVKGYTYLSETFVPKLRSAGVDEATVDTLTRENPFHAFARPR